MSKRANKRKTIYTNPPLEALETECREGEVSFSARLGDIVERYDALMKLTNAPELTDIEKMILGEVVLGSVVSPTTVRYMHESVMDAATGTEDERKALHDKIKNWSPIERIAAIESLGI